MSSMKVKIFRDYCYVDSCTLSILWWLFMHNVVLPVKNSFFFLSSEMHILRPYSFLYCFLFFRLLLTWSALSLQVANLLIVELSCLFPLLLALRIFYSKFVILSKVTHLLFVLMTCFFLSRWRQQYQLKMSAG